MNFLKPKKEINYTIYIVYYSVNYYLFEVYYYLMPTILYNDFEILI